jgi:hypothetical protein
MGDLNSGGGGSVHWSINIKNPGPVTQPIKQPQGRYLTKGSDEGGKKGQSFTIRIKLPKRGSLIDFMKTLDQEGNRVVFKLPIENDKSQIHIHWPDKGAKN